MSLARRLAAISPASRSDFPSASRTYSSPKEIARGLGLSVSTVRTLLNGAYEMLGVECRVELALYASHLEDAGSP